MKVTQEKLPGSQVGLEIEIPAEMSQKTYEQVVGKFMRSAQIPGFRKGKVPRQVVLQRLGPERIKAAAVEELIENSLKEAITQVEVEAIGSFQLRSSFDELVSQFKPGEALTFSASVDVPPEVRLSQYTDFNLQVPETQFDPTQVEAVLTEQQTERATLIPVEGRTAQLGDTVLVDFSGRLNQADTESGDGPLIPGAQAEDFQLELTPGRFIEGFIDGIVGMQVDEIKTVPVIFPQDYPQEDVAGRAATFTITLKEIKEKELPILDDDFAQQVSEFQTLAELQSFIENRFREETKQKTQASIETALLDEILKSLEVDIPETLITNEVNYLLTQTASRLQGQGVDIKQLFTQEALPQMRERLRPEAISRLKRTLVLAEVAKRESIKAEPQEIEERVKALKEQYKDREVDSQKLKQVVEEELLQEKVMQWLVEHSQIELVAPETATSPAANLTDPQDEVTESRSPAENFPGPQPEEPSAETRAD